VYTFSIKGVSRALLQELARHRHVSMSVESTRWALKRIMENPVSMEDLVLPEGVPDYAKGKLEFLLNTAKGLLDRGFSNDVVKYLMPECIPTNIVLTLNLRELRHIYRLRTDKRALKEFRDLMKDILESLPTYHRELLTYGIDK
jgi:thymidylate synthase (FAD)